MKEEAPFLKSVIAVLLFFSSVHMVLELQYFIWHISNGSSSKQLSKMYSTNNVPYENHCYFWLLQNFMMLSNAALLIFNLGFIYMKNLKWLYANIGVSVFKVILAIIWFAFLSQQFIDQSKKSQLICDGKLMEEDDDGYSSTYCTINDLFLLETQLAITISLIQLALSVLTPLYIKALKYEIRENQPLIFTESLLN